MTSLRTRLFAILVATTGLIWLCAAAWIYIQTKNEVEHVLDTRLQEAARMVQSLVTNTDGTASHHALADPAVVPQQAGYDGSSLVRSGRSTAALSRVPAGLPMRG
jgi:two-component system sensor histidine kinase QseC